MPRSKDPVSEKLRVAKLFGVYGPLLSERQKKFINLHCNEDLSLSEIAEEEGISRQAVFDAIKQGKKRLTRFESVLSLCGEDESGEPGAPAVATGVETAPEAPSGASLHPPCADRIRQVLLEIESLCESGVVYDTRRLRQGIDEIRRLLDQA